MLPSGNDAYDGWQGSTNNGRVLKNFKPF